MKLLLQKLAIWFYEKMDCRSMHDSDFWTHHIWYATGKDWDGKVVVAEMNRITNELKYKCAVRGKGWYNE